VTVLESPERRRSETRWLLIGLVAVAVFVVAQFVGGLVRVAVEKPPTYLEKLQTCLTERKTPYEPATSDPIASSASRGALRTTVAGNGVTVVLGRSEDEAKRIVDDYSSVGSPGPRLEHERKVVFLWDEPPTSDQHAFMVLCTLDAEE
jgi:hypothetical protein